jgi:hypothetical protein
MYHNLLQLVLTFVFMGVSTQAWAKCDISEEENVASKYAFVLSAKVSAPYAKELSTLKFGKLPKAVKDCIKDVDLSFELGDGYYDLRYTKYFAIYYPNSSRLAGYAVVSGLTFTEGSDPSEVTAYTVRYNRHGQRVSAHGQYN